jgi:hypothetical protein
MPIRNYLNRFLAVMAESSFVSGHLSTYPHHKHTSKELLPAERPEFRELLKEISCLIGG